MRFILAIIVLGIAATSASAQCVGGDCGVSYAAPQSYYSPRPYFVPQPYFTPRPQYMASPRYYAAPPIRYRTPVRTFLSPVFRGCYGGSCR